MGRKSRKKKAPTQKVSTDEADGKPEVHSESPSPAVTFQPKCELFSQLCYKFEIQLCGRKVEYRLYWYTP